MTATPGPATCQSNATRSHTYFCFAPNSRRCHDGGGLALASRPWYCIEISVCQLILLSFTLFVPDSTLVVIVRMGFGPGILFGSH